MRVLVTGAGGFIGRALSEHLKQRNIDVVSPSRRSDQRVMPTSKQSNFGRIAGWQTSLPGSQVVIHLAARAHVTREVARDPIEEFRSANVAPTLNLFKGCQALGVRRFVFVSSIGVNGVATAGKPFRYDDIPNPTEPYAISKWEAENGLRELASLGPTELVIVRPALVYGAHAKGNFQRLMSLIRAGWPLPFGSLTAERSVLGLNNLCNLLFLCLEHKNAADQVLLAADSDPISTRDLITELAEMMRRQPRLLRLAPAILDFLGGVTGMQKEVQRLTSSLVVDSTKTKHLLDWRCDAHSALDMREMVSSFLSEHNGAP